MITAWIEILLYILCSRVSSTRCSSNFKHESRLVSRICYVILGMIYSICETTSLCF
ncbi:hypothetical protein PVAP13_5KG560507 [Panicum virgatum]|uniref:Uncharacterized protein n=1 Tax=Panicum virgatum TaxID=38727 RepID=A0A8T0SUZ3_PANVG|nr:hypothetical protein PVAP13_5KG560507 [Panicum virgatum]